MRVFLSISLFLIAIASGYLFATGATHPPWEWGNADFLERLLAPFQVFSFFSGFLVLVSVLALLLALLCFECEGSQIANSDSRRAWGRALEVTFFINVVLVGAVLTILWFVTQGNPGVEPRVEVVGALFSIGLLEVTLGTVVAIFLFFLKKTKVLYFSTLAVHLTEMVVLSLIFFLGTSA